MSSGQFNNEPIDALLHRMCEERLSEADRQELLRRLHESEADRRRYMEFIQLSISLADWSLSVFPQQARADGPAELTLSRYPDITPKPASVCRPVARKRRVWPVGVFAIAAAALLAISIGLMRGDQAQLAGDTSPSGLPPEATLVSSPLYVARIVEVTPDAEWDAEAMPGEFLMRLRPGDKLKLKRGLAKVEFYSGAKLILHGPTTFEPTGMTAAYLHEGSVSGHVDGADFLLVTPTAEVVDLGTEFGVSVGPSSNTDVHVFNGKVSVRSDQLDPRFVNESVNLTEGMAVRVGGDGRLSDSKQADAFQFSRRFAELASPNEDGAELSLVDIMCGGSGRGQRLAAAIDPLTGDWDRVGWQKPGSPGTRRGNSDYHASPVSLLIDGAFIPASTGRPQQIDSVGSRVTLPNAHGSYTWGPIWARRFTKDLEILPNRDENDFWGADTFPVITGRLSDSKHGGIGIHASVGVTFNLQDVRDLHAAEIDSFTAVLTNLDNSEAHNPEYAQANERSANFFVVIDGEVRYRQLRFRRNVEGVRFEVPIALGDRMLTLLSTDADNTNKYDHIVLIDPVLNLQSDAHALRVERAESLLNDLDPKEAM